MRKTKPNANDLDGVLYSNQTPTTLQCASLREGVRSLDAKLKSIISHIARLRQEQEEVERQLEKHRAALNPLRLVPTELWGEIFIHVMDVNRTRWFTAFDRGRLLRLALV